MILWAAWRRDDGLGFRIPFTSWPKAVKWLEQRRLLDHAYLEWDSDRPVRGTANALHRKKLKPVRKRLA